MPGMETTSQTTTLAALQAYQELSEACSLAERDSTPQLEAVMVHADRAMAALKAVITGKEAYALTAQALLQTVNTNHHPWVEQNLQKIACCTLEVVDHCRRHGVIGFTELQDYAQAQGLGPDTTQLISLFRRADILVNEAVKQYKLGEAGVPLAVAASIAAEETVDRRYQVPR